MFEWLFRKRGGTEEGKIISIDAYVVGRDYGLEKPLIVIGFSGGGHEVRVESEKEFLVRGYLEDTLMKKQIRTETRSTKGFEPGKRGFRGNGISDRSYHEDIGMQFHFYEGSDDKKLRKVIKKLEERYKILVTQRLPNFLASDLENLI